MSTAPPALTPQPAPFARRYQRVLREGTWVAIGQAVSAVAGLVGTRLITQVVAPKVFGLASLLLAGEIFARSVFCSPALSAGIRFYPDAQRTGQLRRLRELMARVMMRNVLWIFPALTIVAWLYLKQQPLRTAIACALGAFLIVDVARSMEMSILSGARRQARSAIASMIEAIARPLLILLGVKLIGSSALAVVAGTGAAAFAALALLRRRVAQDQRISLIQEETDASDNDLVDSVQRFARPLIPVFLIIWITSLSDRYIIQWFVKDTSAVGIYAAGYGLISQPFVMTNSVLSLTLRPIYFTAASQKKGAHARRTFITWIGAAFAISAVGVVLATLLRRQVVGLFLAPRYARTVELVPWIAAGYFFYVVQQTLEQNLMAHRRTGAVLVEQAFGAVVSIVATIPLVRFYGALGAAYACPIYFGAQCVLTGIFVGAQKRSTPK